LVEQEDVSANNTTIVHTVIKFFNLILLKLFCIHTVRKDKKSFEHDQEIYVF